MTTIDRNAPATLGDLLDLEERLEEKLTEKLTEKITRSLSVEIGRVANVIMEHTTSLIRGAGDHVTAVEQRLDAHVADVTVHRRPRRS